jgi:hypothetical protein
MLVERWPMTAPTASTALQQSQGKRMVARKMGLFAQACRPHIDRGLSAIAQFLMSSWRCESYSFRDSRS